MDGEEHRLRHRPVQVDAEPQAMAVEFLEDEGPPAAGVPTPPDLLPGLGLDGFGDVGEHPVRLALRRRLLIVPEAHASIIARFPFGSRVPAVINNSTFLT